MSDIILSGFHGSEIEEGLFGGNLIATRGTLDGDGQYIDAVEDLSVSGLRYPGGSITEYYFDITDPDRNEAAHSVTGEIKSIIPLSDFIKYAGETGREVTLVIPTRHYMSDEKDRNGDRYSSVDEAGIRQFVKDVVAGKYGDCTIRAFEIGNEYWHSGDMNSVEYGRVAADMINIVDDELSRLELEFPGSEKIDILVQMGTNHGTGNLDGLSGKNDPLETLSYFEQNYGISATDNTVWSSGNLNFANISNQMILNELIHDDALENVDAVVAHIYSTQTDFSRNFALNQIDQTWIVEEPDLDIYVTEWNQKSAASQLQSDQDYGLQQAHEMIKLVETFVGHGVDAAHVWPLIQRTHNALNDGFSYDDPNVPGEMFRLMADNLTGKRVLDFAGDDPQNSAARFDQFEVHGFADKDDLVLYVASEHTSGVLDVHVGIDTLVMGSESADISILGVAPTENPFDSGSRAEMEHLNADGALIDGQLDIPLDPGEIIQVVLHNYIPTEELGELFGSDEVEGDLPWIPMEDPSEIPDEEVEGDLPWIPVEDPSDLSDLLEEEDEVDEVDDGMAGLGWLLALIPIALLAAGAG